MTNRERFLKLLQHNGLTQAESAELISKITQRPLSVRTIRSWLNCRDKPSSRPCPEWAVIALQDAVLPAQCNSVDRLMINAKCLKYASERAKYCGTRHTMVGQVDIWREFIFFLSGAGENVGVRVSDDNGKPSVKTNFVGLQEMIGKDLPIEILEYI